MMKAWLGEWPRRLRDAGLARGGQRHPWLGGNSRRESLKALPAESAESTHRANWWVWVPVPLTGLIAAAGPMGRPLWMDEAWTQFAAQLSPADLIRLASNYDAVLSTYYLLVHVWSAGAGNSLAATRSLSIVAATIAAAGVVALGRRLAGPSTALLAGALFAILPSVMWYGTEARPYAVVLALVTWSTYAFVRWQERDRSSLWLGLYVGLLALSTYVHAFSLTVAAAHTVTLVLCRVGWRRVLMQVSAVIVSVSLAFPILFLASLQRTADGYFAFSSREADFYAELLVGPVSPVLSIPAVALGVLLALLSLSAIVSRREHASRSLSSVLVASPWLAVPQGSLIAASIVTWQVFPRHVVVAAPALAILAAMGLRALPLKWAFATAVIMLIAAFTTHVGLHGVESQDSWDVKRAVLDAEGRPGDVVLAQDHIYALLPAVDAVGLVMAQDMRELLVNAVPVADFEAEIVRDLASFDRAWLVRYDARPSNTDPRFSDILQRAGFCRISTFDGGNAPIALFERCGDSDDEVLVGRADASNSRIAVP